MDHARFPEVIAPMRIQTLVAVPDNIVWREATLHGIGTDDRDEIAEQWILPFQLAHGGAPADIDPAISLPGKGISLLDGYDRRFKGTWNSPEDLAAGIGNQGRKIARTARDEPLIIIRYVQKDLALPLPHRRRNPVIAVTDRVKDRIRLIQPSGKCAEEANVRSPGKRM